MIPFPLASLFFFLFRRWYVKGKNVGGTERKLINGHLIKKSNSKKHKYEHRMLSRVLFKARAGKLRSKGKGRIKN